MFEGQPFPQKSDVLCFIRLLFSSGQLPLRFHNHTLISASDAEVNVTKTSKSNGTLIGLNGIKSTQNCAGGLQVCFLAMLHL